MMDDKALDMVRQALVRYIDVPAEQIQMNSTLIDLQVDSLTLAEMLFELEDRLGKTLSEAPELPKTIADVVALIRPYLDA